MRALYGLKNDILGIVFRLDILVRQALTQVERLLGENFRSHCLQVGVTGYRYRGYMYEPATVGHAPLHKVTNRVYVGSLDFIAGGEVFHARSAVYHRVDGPGIERCEGGGVGQVARHHEYAVVPKGFASVSEVVEKQCAQARRSIEMLRGAYHACNLSIGRLNQFVEDMHAQESCGAGE